MFADFPVRKSYLWILSVLLGLWKKISNSTQTWIPSKLKNKVIRDCITSVNIMYFFVSLPQFEQIKEVCLHAGHASVHVNKPVNVCKISVTWVSELRWNSKMFLNYVLTNPPRLLKTELLKDINAELVSTSCLFQVNGLTPDLWSWF